MKTPLKALLAIATLSTSISLLRAADAWRPLWNGNNFDGWHVIGKGEWKIEQNAIRGLHAKTDTDFGHLVSDALFTDFTVRLKFKAVQGNSGLYFRAEEKGASGISGFQAEIDARVDVGGLYETNGRGWVVHPSAPEVATWFKPDTWNEMIVRAQGGNVTVFVNGRKSAEVHNDPGRTTGRFALQLHGRQDGEVWFKDIEILAP